MSTTPHSREPRSTDVEKSTAFEAAPANLPAPMPREFPDTSVRNVIYVADVSALMARRQSELLAFVALVVVALVALGISPYVAVSTAFAAGMAAIELRRRSDRK